MQINCEIQYIYCLTQFYVIFSLPNPTMEMFLSTISQSFVYEVSHQFWHKLSQQRVPKFRSHVEGVLHNPS
jgi:hypothetical protein